MKMQYLCQSFTLCTALCLTMQSAHGDPAIRATPAHDYPTIARVEYVNECRDRARDKLAALYQCACVIDRIADALSYDDFVEASTYARYATLPGEGGGIFRDSQQAKALARRYRDLESASLSQCGMTAP